MFTFNQKVLVECNVVDIELTGLAEMLLSLFFVVQSGIPECCHEVAMGTIHHVEVALPDLQVGQ